MNAESEGEFGYGGFLFHLWNFFIVINKKKSITCPHENPVFSLTLDLILFSQE